MKLSAVYASVGNFTRANEIAADPTKDFDVHDYLGKVVTARDEEGRAEIAKIAGRSYASGDINTPRLSGFSVDYQDGSNYIADLAAPIVKGDAERRYTKFSRRDAGRMLDLKVSSKGMPKESSIDISSGTYLEDGYAEIQKIAKKDLADARDIPSLLMKHARSIRGDLKRDRERRVADKFMSTSNYAASCYTSISSTNRWDVGPATSTADPIKDIRITAMSAAAVAGTLNAGACSKPVAEYLRAHPKVVAAAGTRASDRVLSYDELRQLLDLQYLFVGDAKYDSAGSAVDPVYDSVWGKGFSVFSVQPNASDDDPSFMKTFEHLPMQFEQSEDNVPGTRGVIILKGSCEHAIEVVASDRAFLLATVIS